MATKRDDYELNLRATDRASEVVGRVADEVERLDGEEADVTITAEDRASSEVRELMRRIEGLTDDDKKVILSAEAKKLEAEVKRATLLLGKVDGEEAEAVLDARNQAQAKLDAVQGELNAIDGRIADATLEADDRATADINDVDSKLDRLDRRSVDAEVDADVKPGLQGLFDGVGALPGNIGALGPLLSRLATPGGAAAVLAGLFSGAALSTSQMSLDVNSLANFTGEDFSYTDKFLQVAESWGNLDLNDLFEIIAELQQKITETPDLAEKFGVDPEFVLDHPLQGIVALIDGIRDSSLSASEKAQAMFDLFGEEGAKQLIPLLTNVEDLSALIEDMPELVTEESIQSAKDMQMSMSDLKANLREFVNIVGPGFLDFLAGAAEGLVNVADFFRDVWDAITPDSNNIVGDGLGWMERWIEGLEEGKTAAEAFKDASNWSDASKEWARVEDEIAQVNEKIRSGTPLVEAWNEVFGAGGEMAAQHADALGLVTDAQGDAADATQDATEAIDEQRDALEEEADQLEENIDLLTEYIDAQRNAYDAGVDFREATQDTTEALEKYNEVAQDTEATEVDRREAGERVIDAMVDEADAAVDLARANAAARGETLSATQAANVQISTYSRLASQIPRELIPQYVNMLMAILDIPEERRTEVTAAVESGDVAEINRVLSDASRTRDAAIRADADQRSLTAVKNQLNALTQPRSVYVGVHGPGAGGARGRAPGVPQPRAAGDPYTSRGIYRVGEQGEEIIQLPEGAKITPNWRLNEAERDRGPSTVVNNYMTINAPAGTTPERVINAERRYRRIQGTTL